MRRPRAWVAWSSGKDSAWALHVATQAGDLEVVGLLTTLTAPFDRVTMHGVRHDLVQVQAAATGLPLHTVTIPAHCSHEAYAAAMRRALAEAKRLGVTQVVFGDISLADVRAYREEQLAQVGLVGRFPLWEQDTTALAQEMIRAGLRATVTCLDPRRISADLAGSQFDEAFLAALPEEADPCGENGEFHTFAWDGPMFRRRIRVRRGPTIERDRFVYTDLARPDAG